VSRIFISHSSLDNDWAIRTRDWLVVEGWGSPDDIFLDLDPERGIAAGERWKEALQKAAHRCEVVVALVSPQWLASPWCKAELDAARLMGKKVIVALIGGDKTQLPLDLVDEQWVDLAADPTGFERLKHGLKHAGLDPSSFPFPEGRRPYPGFAALEEEDAAIFFGRDAQIVRGLDKLRGLARVGVERMLIILGASGAGKSSFMRAGLWPRLKRDDLIWLPIPSIRPERAIISGKFGLAQSLEQTIKEPHIADAFKKQGLPRSRAAIRDFIDSSEYGLTQLFAAIRSASAVQDLEGRASQPPTLVLPIDQGEELFNEEGATEARRFLAILARTLAVDRHTLAIIAMRSDAFPRLQSDPLIAAVPKDTFTLDLMLEGSWRDVIEGPARLVKPKALEIDPQLTDALLRDVKGQDALPLLAFTLERLYNAYHAEGRLTVADYDKIDRIKGVIDTAVFDAFAEGIARGELPKDKKEQLALMRAAFIPHLARVNAAGQFVRRVALREEIPQQVWPLLDRFADRRLITKDRRSTLGVESETIEVAHEALLREWKDLNDALKDEREFLVAKSQLEQDVVEWLAAPKSAKTGTLLTGNKLTRARDWLEQRPQDLSADERHLVQASVDAAARQERRKAAVRRMSLGVTASTAVIFCLIGLYTFDQSIRSRLSEILATLRNGELQAASSKFRELAATPFSHLWAQTTAAKAVGTEMLETGLAYSVPWTEDLEDYVGSIGQSSYDQEDLRKTLSCGEKVDLCVSGGADYELDARGSRYSFHIGPKSFATASAAKTDSESKDGKEATDGGDATIKVAGFYQPDPSQNLIAMSADASLVAVSENRAVHIWYVDHIKRQNQAPDRTIQLDQDFDNLAFVPATHDLILSGRQHAIFVTLEPRRATSSPPAKTDKDVPPVEDSLPPAGEVGELSERQIKLEYDASARRLPYYGAPQASISIKDEFLHTLLARTKSAQSPNMFQIRPNLLAVTLDGTECQKNATDRSTRDDVLADLLLLKLSPDRSEVDSAALIVCGPTIDNAWGEKNRLSVAIVRPPRPSPIYLSGRHFSGLHEITEEGIPARLYLECEPNAGLVQTPSVHPNPGSKVISYNYAKLNSECSGSTGLIYNPVRKETYSFGMAYNSPSGSTRIERFSLERRQRDFFPNTHKAFFDRVGWLAASNDGKLIASHKDEAGLELFLVDETQKISLPRLTSQAGDISSQQLSFSGPAEVSITAANIAPIRWLVPEVTGGQFDFVATALQPRPLSMDLKYSPRVGEYYLSKIALLLDGDKDGEAIKVLARAAARDPALQKAASERLATYYLQKGQNALTSGENDVAKAQFVKALNFKPSLAPDIDKAWADVGAPTTASSKPPIVNTDPSPATSKPPMVSTDASPATSNASQLVTTAPEPPRNAAAVRPSFDCEKDKAPDEQTICGATDLARMDLELERLFKNIRGRLDQPGKAQLLDDQRAFLKSRKACGADEHCIAALYSDRIRKLAAQRK
jgi:uncharacterized protein YecT (DUF1311 family)